MNTTITTEQQEAIAARLEGMILKSGLGSEESACSIAAINLALTGELSDDIPACMSEVIGRWIIPIQDSMPSGIRNSQRWKTLLPLAAGTGREQEQERLGLIMDWLWSTVLPALQAVADRGGFGDAWSSMTTRRTEAAAKAAAYAAQVAAYAAGGAAWFAAGSASYAADAAWWAAGSADAAAYAAKAAATVAGYAANADTDAWITFDPCGLLEQLICVGEQK